MSTGAKRVLRLGVGIVLAGTALAVIVFEQLAGASAGAVINARLTTLQAPVAGELRLVGHPLGATVAEGEELGAIANRLVDTSKLDDLLLERKSTEARRARIGIELAGIDEALAELQERRDRYVAERIRQLEAELDATGAQIMAARAELDLASAEEARAEHLHRRGHAAAASLETVQASAKVAERRIEQLTAERAVVATELAAARAGIFLHDGNDAPFSEQEAKRLTVRRSALLAQREEAERRIASLDARIDAERRRIAALRNTTLRANVDGQVWEILTASGEHVYATQDLVRLLDCASMIVTASVTESVYNDLSIGDTGWFRVNGTRLVFEGTVSRLAGEGAAAIYHNLAVAPTDEHLKRFDVKLHVPALREHPRFGCAVGKTGRVFFSRRPLDWLRHRVVDLWS